MLNAAVIGLGFMGRTHVAAYQAAQRDGLPCRLVAVCDTKSASAAQSAGNLASGAEAASLVDLRHCTVADELIADPGIHLLSICTPTDTHVDLAARALRSGKHVLLEKPVALTADAVRRLADVAADAEQTAAALCMPALCMRFWPGWTWLKNAVSQNSFGRVRSARFTRLGSRPTWSDFYADPARCGGALMDLHIHDTDFIAHLFGPPASVVSTGSVDHLTTLYRYAHIPHVAAEGGWDQHAGFAFTMRYLVTFEHATADFDISRNPPLLLCRDGRAEAVNLDPGTGYDGEIRHFINCLAAGRPPGLSLREAILTHEILDAERQSLESHLPVSPGREATD